MKLQDNKRGIALLTCIAMLSILSLLAVSFARQMQSENQASENYGDLVQARVLSASGVEYTLANLYEQSKASTFSFDQWKSSDPPETDLTEISSPSFAAENDQVDLPHSFIIKQGNTKENFCVTLRVTDNSGKININDPNTDLLTEMLNRLGEKIGISDIGDKILELREELEEESFGDLEEISSGFSTTEIEALKPFLCTRSYQESIYFPGEVELLESYPININTAPQEILEIMMEQISGRSSSNSNVTFTNGSAIATMLMARRSEKLFQDWNEFGLWLRALAVEGFATEEQLSLIFANVCPLVMPNHFNPDSYHKWPVSRNDLDEYTFAGTLAPGGVFQVESRGFIYQNEQNKIVADHIRSLDVESFTQVIHRTQEDFHLSQNRLVHDSFGLDAELGLFPAITGPTAADTQQADSTINSEDGTVTYPGTQPEAPSKTQGFIMKTNGYGRESSLHVAQGESNFFDGSGGPVYSVPIVENNERMQLDFFYKPDNNFDATKTQKIFRSVAPSIQAPGLQIATEIYWVPDEGGHLLLSRTLCQKNPTGAPLNNPPAIERNGKTYHYGVLNNGFFQELRKIGHDIYEENLVDLPSPIPPPSVGIRGRVEKGNSDKQLAFGFDFARKIFLAFARGEYNQSISVEMSFASANYISVVYPAPVGGVPIPDWQYITGNSDDSKSISVNPSDYTNLIFSEIYDTFTTSGESDQPPGYVSLRESAHVYIDPIIHPHPMSRSQFKIPFLVPMKSGGWYRIGLLWDGMRIESCYAVDGNTPVIMDGQEQKEMVSSPLLIWRIMDPTFTFQAEYTGGTFLLASSNDIWRYKRSSLTAIVSVPDATQPFLSHAHAHFFVPFENLTNDLFLIQHAGDDTWYEAHSSVPLNSDVQKLVESYDNLHYKIILGGEPYQSSMVSEVRFRFTHMPKIYPR